MDIQQTVRLLCLGIKFKYAIEISQLGPTKSWAITAYPS